MALDPNSAALSDTLVVLGAAGLVIPAFARLRIPSAIGFIIVGAIVGPHGLGALVDRAPWLVRLTIVDGGTTDALAEFGIVLLLFSVGLELSFRRLWAMRRRVAGVGAAELVGNAALIACTLWAFGTASPAAVGLGVALALSSTALVLPIAGTTSAVGRLAFAMLLFEDLALVPTIFLLGALGRDGGDASALIRTLVVGAAVIATLLVAGRLLLPRLFAQAARTRSPELFLSMSLLVVMVASLATLAAGLSPIVGALIAGLVIAETDFAHEVDAVVVPFKNLALGVFLLTVGMQLDLAYLAVHWADLLAATAVILAVKTLFTAALLRFGGAPTGVAVETGVLMASPSELTLVVLASALAAGLIDADAASFWSAVTALGLTLTPPLAWVGKQLSNKLGERAEQPVAAADLVGVTLVIGYGRVGQMVASMLERHALSWMAIEADIDAVRTAASEGRPVRYGDAGRSGAVEALDLAHVRAVVLTMNDPAENVRLTRRLRAQSPALTIIVRARDAAHAIELYAAGASDAVPETLEASLQLSEAVLVDLGVAMGPVIVSVHEKRDELRGEIKRAAGLSEAPRLKPL